jgi:hypothetical protein
MGSFADKTGHLMSKNDLVRFRSESGASLRAWISGHLISIQPITISKTDPSGKGNSRQLANVVNRQPAPIQFAYDLEVVNFQDVEISLIRRELT